MTREPRLLDDETRRGLGRELLQAGASVRLSEQRKSEVWARIASGLPPTGGSGASEPPPAAPTGAAGPLFSVTTKLGVALGVGALWVGAWFAGTSLARRPPAAPPPAMSAVHPAPPNPAEQRAETPPAPPAPSAARPEVSAILPAPPLPRNSVIAVAEPSAPEPPGEPDAPAPGASGEVAPMAPASPEEIARQERINLLREEAAMTRSARGALRSGNAPLALQILGQIVTKFGGRGELHQEREALTIEALARTGRQPEASARASAFLRNYPASPLAPDVKSFVR